jgi:ABC-2 type transport system ATP-binding protein
MIEAQHLTKRYGDRTAVDNLTFTVRPGIVTGFLGPNGSGKSTTMRMIMGLDYPNAGRAIVNGRPYDDLRWPLREVGALLEAKAIHPGRPAWAHLWMLAETNDIPRSRVDEVIAMVGLESAARQRAGKFSLGMSQRLGIAAALLGDPGVLIFDEPVNGLDPDGIRWARLLLRRLASEGRTVFVSSHLMSEMALTADEVIVIGRGRFLAQQPVAEMTSRSATRFVRVRSPQLKLLRAALDSSGAKTALEDEGSLTVRGIDRAAIGDIAAREGLVLHELASEKASLEDVFMELTNSELEYSGNTGNEGNRP